MRMRAAAIVLGAADCAVALAIAIALFGSGSDPATKGFDAAAGWLVVLLLVATGAPGFTLALLSRAPKSALTLVLGFPVGFVLFYIVAVIAFAF
jgi:uncharacterized membrane protein